MAQTEFEILQSICEESAHEKYGRTLPGRVETNMHAELEMIRKNGYAPAYILARKASAMARAEGILTNIRGNAGASLVSYLCDISETDPGFYVTRYSFMGYYGERMPVICINFETGTASRFADKLADFCEKTVDRGELMIQDHKRYVEFSGSEEGKKLWEVSLYEFSGLDVLKKCSARKGIVPGTILPYEVDRSVNQKVMDAFCRGKTRGIPLFEGEFMEGMLKQLQPGSIFDLTKILGLALDWNMYYGNQYELIKDGLIDLGNAIASYDDVYEVLRCYLGDEEGWRAAEKVRGGKPLEKDVVERLKRQGIQEWIPDVLGKAGYLYSRAHQFSYALVAYRTMWCKKA